MLELDITDANGKRQRLEMADRTSLQLEMTSPFFDDDLTEGTFSYPLDVPFTEKNRKSLGSPEMLESMSSLDLPSWPARVGDRGVPVLNDAKATLIGHKGNYAYLRGNYSLTITGPESVFGALIAGKKLTDLHLGGIIDFMGYDSRQWASLVMKGYLPKYRAYIGFAPIYWPEFIDTGREDYTTENIAGDIVNNVIHNMGYIHGWDFGRPQSAYPTNETASGTAEYCDYRTVPFLQLHYVLKAVFKEFGYSVSGDFLDDPDYAKLCLFNNCALDCFNSIYQDITRRMVPADHVPAILISDFLKALQLAFNFGYDWLPGKKVRIRYRTALIQSREVMNMTTATVDEYEATKTDIATGGAKLGWHWDDKDGFISDRVKDDIDLTKLRVSSLTAAAIPVLAPAAAEGDLAYVINENAYYIYQANAWAWYKEAQQSQVIGNGEKSYDIGISPLSQLSNYVINITTNITDMPACRQPGSYWNGFKRKVTAECGLRIFYLDAFTTGGSLIARPRAFVHNISPTDGTKRVATSLCWNGQASVYERHWRRWIEAQISGWSVKAFFVVPPGGIDALSWSKKVQIGSVQYMIQVLRPVIGSSEPVEVQLLSV